MLKLFLTFISISLLCSVTFVVLASDPFKPPTKILSKKKSDLKRKISSINKKNKSIKIEKKASASIGRAEPVDDIYLNLIVESDTKAVALLNDFIWVKVGDSVDEWVVHKIQGDCVFLVDGDLKEKVCISHKIGIVKIVNP